MEVGFIITRKITNPISNQYWKRCCTCIRQFYPTNPIVILDDYSDTTYEPDSLQVTQFGNCTLVKCDPAVKGRGELLSYCYYLTHNAFQSAVFIHDSVFINKYVPFDTLTVPYSFLWEFEHGHGTPKDELFILKQFKSTSILNMYYHKNKWKGCFGGMMYITKDFLQQVHSKYSFYTLIPYVHNRHTRCCFERVVACMFQDVAPRHVLFGDIFKYCKWALTFDEMVSEFNTLRDLPVIKVWTGR